MNTIFRGHLAKNIKLEVKKHGNGISKDNLIIAPDFECIFE